MEDGKRSKHVYRIVVRVSRASFPTFLIIPSVCHTRAQSCELMTHDGRWPKQVGNSSFLGTIPRCSLHASQGSQVQGVPRRTTQHSLWCALHQPVLPSIGLGRAKQRQCTLGTQCQPVGSAPPACKKPIRRRVPIGCTRPQASR